MKKNNIINKKRLSILNLSKSIVIKNGWSADLFKIIEKENIISKKELTALFPEGYKQMLLLTFDNLNNKLEKSILKKNFLRKPLHKRVREILLTKINIISKEKEFYRKSFLKLIYPNNNKFLIKKIYNSVDLVWYLAGDTSTDFNFYTKRLILTAIYIRVMIFYFNNDSVLQTEEILDESLLKTSKISNIKERFNFIKKNIPNIWSFVKR